MDHSVEQSSTRGTVEWRGCWRDTRTALFVQSCSVGTLWLCNRPVPRLVPGREAPCTRQQQSVRAGRAADVDLREVDEPCRSRDAWAAAQAVPSSCLQRTRAFQRTSATCSAAPTDGQPTLASAGRAAEQCTAPLPAPGHAAHECRHGSSLQEGGASGCRWAGLATGAAPCYQASSTSRTSKQQPPVHRLLSTNSLDQHSQHPPPPSPPHPPPPLPLPAPSSCSPR